MRAAQPGARRVLGLAVIAAAIATTLFLVGVLAPDAAVAASKVGKNVGKEIEAWGKAILLGVVALVAIPILAKRDMAGGVVVAALAVLVGGFVFAPNAVKSVIRDLWSTLGG